MANPFGTILPAVKGVDGKDTAGKRVPRKARKGVSAAASSLGAGKKKQVPSKTRRLLAAAGHEMKENPPKILSQTKRKQGKAVADKQRVAILLSKARAAGAKIPEK